MALVFRVGVYLMTDYSWG